MSFVPDRHHFDKEESVLKKLCSLSLAFCLLFSTALPAFAQDEFNYDEAHDWAIEVGYPEEFLEFVSDDPNFLREVYYEYKDADEFTVSASHSYLYPNTSENARGNIDSNALDFWMVASTMSTNGYMTHVHVRIVYEWVDFPTGCFTDAVIVNWDSSLWYYKQSTSKFTAQMRTGGISGLVYDDLSQPATISLGSLGWYCPIGIYATTTSIYGTAAFYLYPVDSQLPSGTRYTTAITAQYAHSTLSSDGVSIGTSGIDISFSGTYDHLATSTTVTYGV